MRLVLQLVETFHFTIAITVTYYSLQVTADDCLTARMVCIVVVVFNDTVLFNTVVYITDVFGVFAVGVFSYVVVVFNVDISACLTVVLVSINVLLSGANVNVVAVVVLGRVYPDFGKRRL